MQRKSDKFEVTFTIVYKSNGLTFELFDIFLQNFQDLGQMTRK